MFPPFFNRIFLYKPNPKQNKIKRTRFYVLTRSMKPAYASPINLA
jgi:hypothetical protein